MSEEGLYSERRGGDLPLTREGFATLLRDAFVRLKRDGYFAEVLGLNRARWELFGENDPYEASAFFAMKLGDPWPAECMSSAVGLELRSDDEIFDLLELLYRDVVTEPEGESGLNFDRDAGRVVFRETFNPILERLTTPMHLDAKGQIGERAPEPFRRLVEQPLPDEAPKHGVVDRVEDAVSHYQRRNATHADRRAAVVELANVLEYLRADVKQHLLRKDEAALFQMANDFAVRHNKPTTKREWDEPVWLAWMFYLFLATIRLVLELKRREVAS